MTTAVLAFPQNIIHILRQPVALSVAASLGLHGVLWATSPFIPFDSSAATGPLTVDLVPLSPQELNRLPQESTAIFDPSTLTPLTPDILNAVGLLPPIPELPPPPDDIFGTLPSLESLSALPSFPGIAELPPIPYTTELPPPPLSSPFVTVDPTELPDFSPIPLDPDQIALSGDTITLPIPEPAQIPQLPPINPGNLDPNLTNPNLPPLSIPQPDARRPIPQAAIDHLRELQRQERLRRESQDSTSEPTIADQAQEWLARSGSGQPPKKLILDTYRYPKSACPAEGYTTVTVQVDGQGQVTDAEVTRSSNVSDFDEIALKFAKAHNYTDLVEGEPRTFWLPFSFNPEGVCDQGPVPTKPAASPAPSDPPPSAPATTPAVPVTPEPEMTTPAPEAPAAESPEPTQSVPPSDSPSPETDAPEPEAIAPEPEDAPPAAESSSEVPVSSETPDRTSGGELPEPQATADALPAS